MIPIDFHIFQRGSNHQPESLLSIDWMGMARIGSPWLAFGWTPGDGDGEGERERERLRLRLRLRLRMCVFLDVKLLKRKKYYKIMDSR